MPTLKQIRSLPGFANLSDDEIIAHGQEHGLSIDGITSPAPIDQAPAPDEAGALRSYASIPFMQGTADIGGVVGYGLEKSGIAPSMGQALQESAHRVYDRLEARKSQQARDDHAKTIVDDEGNYGGYNLGTLAQDVFTSAPSTVAMGLAGAPLAAGVTAASKAAGVGRAVGKIAGSGALGKALAKGLDTAIGSSVGFGAAEGAYSGASNASQIQHEILNADINQLARHPAFIETYHNETDPALSVDERLYQTRELIATKAGDDVFADTLVKTGLISGLTGGGMFGVVRGNMARQAAGEATDGIMKSAGKSVVSEGLLQEAPQSALEQQTSNQARQDYVDQNQAINQGVLNAGIQGGLAGAAMGAAGAGGGALLNRGSGSHRENDRPQGDQLDLNNGQPGPAPTEGPSPDDLTAEYSVNPNAPAATDDLILTQKGQPFKDRKKAELKNKRLGGGYEIIEHDGGFALKPTNGETVNEQTQDEELRPTAEQQRGNDPAPVPEPTGPVSGNDPGVSAPQSGAVPSGPGGDDTAPSPVSILDQDKKTWIKERIKEQGIGKKHRDYQQIADDLGDRYEEELDQALARASFDVFASHPSNEGVPKTILQDAYEALRDEYDITDEPETPVPPQSAQPVAPETKPATPEIKPTKPAPKAGKKKPGISDKDDLLAVVAKLGGLSRVEAQKNGIDPAHFNTRGGGARYVFHNSQNARTYDAMAEEQVSDEQARHVQRLESLYELARQHDADFGTSFHDTILKLDDLSNDNLAEWEEDLHNDRQSRATTDNAGTDNPGTDRDSQTPTPGAEPQGELGSYTEQEIAEREQRRKKLAAKAKADKKKAEEQEAIAKTVEDLPGEMAGDTPGTGDIFGHTSGMEKVQEGAIPDLDTAAHTAATSPLNDLPEPSQAQKEAGNYKKGHINVQGLDIAIENPRGAKRSGVDASGKPWSVKMHDHYGYIKRTEGADGDQVDVFIGPVPDSQRVFIVNQIDPDTGKFDEHKVMIGFKAPERAKAGYLANYTKGWRGLGSMTELSMEQFKEALKTGKFDKPIKQAPKQKKQAPSDAAKWDAMGYGERQSIAQASGIGGMRKVVHRIAGSKWGELSPGEQQDMVKAMKNMAATEKPAKDEKSLFQGAKQAGIDAANSVSYWKEKASTQANVKVAIMDYLFDHAPENYTEDDLKAIAGNVYKLVEQQAASEDKHKSATNIPDYSADQVQEAHLLLAGENAEQSLKGSGLASAQVRRFAHDVLTDMQAQDRPFREAFNTAKERDTFGAEQFLKILEQVVDQTTKSAAVKADDELLDDELKAALGELGDVLGDVFGGKLNATGKQHTSADLLPALSKVLDLLIRKGLLSFEQSVKKAAELMRANAATSPHVDKLSARQWKAAYNAIAEFTDGTDTEEAVNALTGDEVLALVKGRADAEEQPQAEPKDDAKPAKADKTASTPDDKPYHNMTVEEFIERHPKAFNVQSGILTTDITQLSDNEVLAQFGKDDLSLMARIIGSNVSGTKQAILDGIRKVQALRAKMRAMTREELEAMKVNQLKALNKELGGSGYGSKANLIEHAAGWYKNNLKASQMRVGEANLGHQVIKAVLRGEQAIDPLNIKLFASNILKVVDRESHPELYKKAVKARAGKLFQPPYKGIPDFIEDYRYRARHAEDENKRAQYNDIADELEKQYQRTKASMEKVSKAARETSRKKAEQARAGAGMTLTPDWGVESINGYDAERDDGKEAPVKKAFLAESKKYLNEVAKRLAADGFKPYTTAKGKPEKPVSINEAGPAVSGDVNLILRNGNVGIYVNIGESPIKPLSGGHPQGVSIMARATDDADNNRYATGAGSGNNWLSWDLTAGELADKLLLIAGTKTGARQAIEHETDSTDTEERKPGTGGVAGSGNPALPGGRGNHPAGHGRDGHPKGNEGLLEAEPPRHVPPTDDRETVKQDDSGSRMQDVGTGGKESGGGDALAGQSEPGAAGLAADGTRDGGFTDADRGLVDSAGLTLFGETNKQLSVKLPDYDLADVSIVIDGTGFEVRGRGFETVRKDDFYEAVSAAKTLLDSAKADHEALNEQLDAGEKNKRGNYYIADPEALIAGTPKVRFARNKKAIETYETLIEENREPTEEERDALAGYIGWGSFGQELFQGSWDKPVIRDGWEKEQEWLRDHLGESAWKSAQNSIINAHYTDPPTVGAMWDMVRRLGFKGGRTLEPSTGIGNFLGLMPRDLMELSSITGIELDEMTGNMAKILYPDANIQIKGYQDSKTADDFYDLVIGNWPFAKDGPADRRYNKFNLSLHDYFFVKALDQVRPGGLVIGITSSGTMDKISRMARVEMNRRAVLVDAFRMPMGAFEKYAGTSVVADIIILQKRGTGVEDTGKAWRESVPMRDQNGQPVTTRDGKPVNVNEFWLANPDNVLGNMTVGHGTTFGREGMIVERRDDYAEVLAKLAERLPEAIMTAREHHDNISYITNNTNDRQNSVIVENDKLYVVKGEHLAPVEDLYKYAVKDEKETAKREDQIKRLVGLRKAYGGLLDAERAGLDNTERLRSLLNKQYQDFVKTHGPINKSKALAVFKKVQDPFYPAMASLEVKAGNPKKPVYQPAAILTQSTIRTRRKIDKPSVVDAFIMVRNEDAAFIDIERVAELAKVPAEQAARQLIGSGALFQTPAGNYEVRDIYLSGNVRRKLREAIEAQEAGDEAMTVNIEALKKVLPKDTPYFAIEVSMGSNWVTADQYRQFIADLLGITGDDINDIDVKLMPKGWRVKLESWMNNKPEAQNIWGIPNYPFSRIVNSAFNGSLITIKSKDADGNEFVDEERTKAANEKVDALREEFKSWAWKDPERRVAMERAFNESVNAFANPDFDGSFMRFDGMSLQLGDKPFNLRQHQANAIWRGVANGRGLYAHEVGTGKTFTIAGIAIESRRYGVAKKPLIIAHNANSASVAADTQAMYPGAKVLYVDNLSPATIEQKLYQIANDDWDAVVVPHSLLDRFALTRESLMEMAESEIMALEEEAIASAEEEGFDIAAILDDEDELRKVRGASTAKELVKQRNKIIETINKMAERASRADAIPFEQLGIDMLIVDEAHEFKKPPLTTRMRVKGLNASPSKEGIAMHFLTSYIRKVNGGKGVHLFTGTPITNTLNEIYNQMRYVMGDAMEEANVAEWDAWFNTFAGIVSDVELTSTGEYEAVSRLSGFYNVSELRRFAGQYMDIVFADEMPEFVPRPTASGKTLQDTDLTEAEREELLNGRSETPVGRPYKKVINETAPMTDVQRNILNELVRLARMFKAADRKTRRLLRNHKSNPVLVETAAAQAAFDPRLRDMNAPDLPDYKANRVVNNVMNHYKEHKLATQVIFMDKGYNDKAERTIYGPDGFRMTNLEGQSLKETVPTFNVSKDIVAKLVAQGIPKEEIAVVTGSTSKEKRKEIADKMNRAEIRVVIGMTATLGVGVNMQENLRAIHHLDAPWMPGELEQRNGRGHRQGNKWNTVLEYRYLTEGIDGRRWQVLAVKQKFITAFLQADEDTRVIEGDAVDMSGEGIDDISESLSAAAGDPRLLMREKLKSDVNKLENKQRTHDFGVTDAIESARKLHRVNEQTEARIKKSAADAEHFQSYKDKSFSIEIKGKTYTDRRAASEAITAASLAAAANQVIGHFKGFEIVQMVRNNEFRLSREDHYESVNTLASIEANLRNIAKHVEKDRERMAENEQSIKRLIEASKTPFAQADMLEKKRTMLTQLEADIEQYPVPAPSWLRTGAPVGTDAFIRDENEALKKVTIEGHRWGSDDYYVLIDDADGTKPVPYQQILDENNTPIYPVMDFSEPVIIEDGAELDDLPPVPVPSQSGGTVTPKGIKAGDTVKAADGTTYTVTRVYEPALNGDRDKEADWQVEVQASGDEAVIFSANEVTKFSKNQQTFNGSTEKQIRDWLPGRVKGLIDAGKLVVVQSMESVPGNIQSFDADGVEGFYDEKNDALYLVADNLDRDNLHSVLAHELFHRAEATDEKLKAAIDKFDADLRKRFFAASKDRASDIEQAAYRRVMDAGTREKDRLSEFKAYLVTEWSQKPDTFTGTVKKMILDFIAAIRAALFRAGMPLKSITPADLAALAKYGARVNKNAMQPARTGSRKFRASFAGAKARTADTHQLDTAQQRLAKGDDPETIRQETGWHKGADGKWRFEINDKDATLKPLREGEQGARYRSDALENVIDHPALFAAYPGLRDLLVNITVDPDTQSEQGSYADGTEGDDYSFGREPEINVTARTPKKALSTLLHEIQHGIQYIEDFATGGSPGEFTRQIQARPYEGLTNYLGYLQRYSDAPIEFSPSDIQRYESLENFFDDYRLPREITNRMAPDEDIEWGIDLGYDFEEGMEIATILEILADDARRDIEKGTSGPTPFEQYQRLAGEVEARNTQARQTMTDAERKATSPGATQDIANSEVIVAFNGRAMDSAPQPLNATAKSGAKGGRVRFSTAPALYTQAWLNWFGRSKMKRGGAPIKFYHGTNHDFTIFDKAKLAGSTQHSTAGLGFFFTENAEEANRYGSTVHEVYLSIEKPYVTHSWLLSENFEDADGAARFRAKLQQQGYDGIYIKDAGYVVAFESPQVKLTGNKNPSPFDDDIRYSRRSSGGAINDARRQGDAWLKGFLNQQNWDKAIYNLQDRYIDLKRQMEKVVSRGEAIEEFEDARMGEELYHQRTASRVKEFYDQDLGPVLKALHDNRVSLDAFQKFLHARHAPSRNEVMAERNPNQDIIDRELARAQMELEDLKQTAFTPRAMQKALKEVAKWERAKPFAGTEEERLSLSGMSNRESADIIAAFAPEQRRLMDMLGDEIDRINNETLDLMVEYGMEKPKTIQALKKQWEHYVPLHRDEAHPENSNFGHPIGRGFSVRGSGMKTATGSQAQVTNILAHIAAAREQMLTRGEKNRVQMRLAHFIDNHPDPDFATIGKVPMDDKLVNGLVETLPDTNYKNRDNVVVFRVKGRDVAIVFNENKPENVRLALSLKNMDGVDLDKVESIIAKGTRWIAAFNTQYNVVFGVVNLIRDAQGMLLNLSSTPLHGKHKDVFNHMGRALSVIAAVERGWRQGDAGLKAIYDRFNKAGGTTGYRQMFDDVSDRDRTLRDELAKFEAGPVKRGRQWLGKALTDFNTVMENSTRLAVFMTGLEAGLSDDKAASLAKNITVNFNRKGAYTTKLGAFYAFFNASMQGTARMGETLTGPKGKQILVGGVGLGAALTLLGIAAMGADDWEKIPEFVRERSLIVPAPWNKSGYIAIPMPLGFHLLPNIGRKLVESAFGSNRLSTTERFTQLAGSVIGAFNPMGGHDISEVVMPTVLDPALALWRNQDWTGRAIYREDFNSLKPTPGFKRTKDTASWPSRQLAEGINKLTGGTDYKAGAWSPTPDQIDYVFGQLFGGTGREILKAGQLVESSVTGEELPTYKIPLLGRLYGETSGNAVERSAYYDNLRRLNEHEAELKGLRSEPGGSQKAAAYLRANPDARLVLKVKRAQKAIDHIRDRRRDLVRLGASPAKLRILDDRMAKIMKQLNDSVAKTLGS